MTTQMILSIAIFVGVMALVISEKIHRGVAALIGAVLLIVFQVLTFDQAMGEIDFNTIGVLIGMMLFVGIVKGSGLFEYVAIKAAKLSKGDPWKIMMSFIIITALLSALLDNVTTVLLIGPMTYMVCEMLDVNPIPFFLSEILASNIGGTSTLIGDPPNIMIGSATGYDFNDFILNDGICIIFVLAAVILVYKFLYGRKMKVAESNKMAIMELDEQEAIKDRGLFKKSIVMIVLVVVGFMTHGQFNVPSSTVALGAAAIMLVISGVSLDEAVTEVEWPTIGFFLGLFIVVGGLSVTGVLDIVANWLTSATGGNEVVAILLIIWASALISSILDNIPYVATMIPVLTAMQANGMDVTSLWWALSLGACLGGNGTLIGASANVVLSEISKRHGYQITFISYLKTGFPIMILTVAIASVYCIVRYVILV